MGMRSQRFGIGAIFAVHGAVVGTFATRIPTISDHLHLSTGQLGAALFLPAVGSLSMMPFTGRLIHRLGGKLATQIFLALWTLSLALPAFATSLPTLCIALFFYGAVSGMSDIAMNAQGVELEQRMGRSIISSLHGLWSVGGFIGAAIGWLAVRADVDVRWQFCVMAVVLTVAGQAACRLLVTPPPAASGAAEPEPPTFALPSGIVLVIALVAFCAVFAEIAGSDWAAVYMRRVLDADNATAALGYTVFALAMSVSRLTGDRLIRRVGPVRAVRISATAGTAGAVLIVVAVNPILTMVGFGLMGVGIAVVVPLAFAAAGKIGSMSPGGTGHAIAGVATIAYGSGLAAPGAIGGIASFSSLRVSFALVAVLVAIVALSANVVRDRPGGAAIDPNGIPEAATVMEAGQ